MKKVMVLALALCASSGVYAQQFKAMDEEFLSSNKNIDAVLAQKHQQNSAVSASLDLSKERKTLRKCLSSDNIQESFYAEYASAIKKYNNVVESYLYTIERAGENEFNDLDTEARNYPSPKYYRFEEVINAFNYFKSLGISPLEQNTEAEQPIKLTLPVYTKTCDYDIVVSLEDVIYDTKFISKAKTDDGIVRNEASVKVVSPNKISVKITSPSAKYPWHKACAEQAIKDLKAEEIVLAAREEGPAFVFSPKITFTVKTGKINTKFTAQYNLKENEWQLKSNIPNNSFK